MSQCIAVSVIRILPSDINFMTETEIDIVMIVGRKKKTERERKEMEIKTCEEYVLSRVIALDEVNTELAKTIEELRKVIQTYEDDMKFLKDVFNIYAYIDGAGDTSISTNGGLFGSKYNSSTNEKVERIMKIFDLTIDEDEE